MSYQRHAFRQQLSGAEVERLLFHMPTVAARAQNEWARGFAQSIVRQSRRRGWHPSLKQLSVMRELVADLFLHCGNEGGEIELIED